MTAIYSFTSGLEARSGRKTWLILTRSTLIRRASSTAHNVLHPDRLQLELPRITIIQLSHTVTMQISALILLFTATASVSAWVHLPFSPPSIPPSPIFTTQLTPNPQQCFDHDEHFTTNHAQLSEGSDPNNQWGYCPSKKGCCADGKTWYACKNVSLGLDYCTRCERFADLMCRYARVVLRAVLVGERLLARGMRGWGCVYRRWHVPSLNGGVEPFQC